MIGLVLAAVVAVGAFVWRRASHPPPVAEPPTAPAAAAAASPLRSNELKATPARAGAVDPALSPASAAVASGRPLTAPAGPTPTSRPPRPDVSARIRVEREQPEAGEPELLTREQVQTAIHQTERDIARTRVEIDAMEREFLEAGGEIYGGEAQFNETEPLPEVVRGRIDFLKSRLRNEWQHEAWRRARLERYQNALDASR